MKERRNEAGGLRESVVPLTSDDYDLIEMAGAGTFSQAASVRRAEAKALLQRLAQANRYWLPAAPPGVALRVREVGDAAEATVKRAGAAPKDGLFIHEEETDPLDAETLAGLVAGDRSIEDLPLVARTGLRVDSRPELRAGSTGLSMSLPRRRMVWRARPTDFRMPWD